MYLGLRWLFRHVHEVNGSGVDQRRNLEEKFVWFETAVDTVDGADRQRYVLQDFAALQVVNLQNVFDVLETNENNILNSKNIFC